MTQGISLASPNDKLILFEGKTDLHLLVGRQQSSESELELELLDEQSLPVTKNRNIVTNKTRYHDRTLGDIMGRPTLTAPGQGN